MSVHGKGSDDDNVIYANFGTRKRVTSPDETGSVERVDKTVGAVPPAAQRIINLVNNRADHGRITRGKQYARSGNVVDLDVRVGAIHGQVAGSQNTPFAVLIRLPFRDNDDMAEAATILARRAGSMAAAREGKLAPELLDVLIAAEPDDVKVSCTCPDPEEVCKHIVAVVDRLAARIDADPSTVFSMRGLDFHRLEQMVMEQSQHAAAESYTAGTGLSADEQNDLFWSGRTLPEVPRPQVAPALDDSDMDLLRKAMRPVSHTTIDLLRAVSDIEDLYHELTK
ncbi:hypothetical protein [Corynebacterium massiliense]|uniref:SWIM zinc finger family protein n=1 Tax=Corynebacterium massiliense TaxID=441501 RepID=UPI002355BE65|nr:hypothetical protein [Corynebacterium massiliense]